MAGSLTFEKKIQSAYQALLNSQSEIENAKDQIKIDLHCHDFNSDVTDVLLGRILRFPETWLKTDELLKALRKNQCNGLTITNHNNARSCWQLLESGTDILAGAEFTCHFKEYQSNFHVLAYGFTPEQETKLNKYRSNLYRFLTYTVENDIPTILPHPLYFDVSNSGINPEMYEKLALMFERFEVLNGQRDTWQNLLTWEWLNGIDEETIENWQQKHGINSNNFCRDIYKKRFTGGSDDHMGLFAGSCGSYLQVENLENKLQNTPMSQLALDAIRNSKIHPYGQTANHEKLNIAFIDYLSQIALYMKEPGLVRMFLHKGSLKDKLICLGFSNVMQELRRHKFTMFFFKTLHEALKGKRPGLLSRLKTTPDFRPLVKQIDDIAKSKDKDPELYLQLLKEGLPGMFTTFNKVVAKRIKNRTSQMLPQGFVEGIDAASLINKFEIPTHFRALFEDVMDSTVDDVSQVNISKFFDTLSFPVLASAIIAGASLISTRVLNNQRSFVNEFAKSMGKHIHPERVLWLTDTLKDRNGVSSSLSRKLEFIKNHNIDIDFLICHNAIEEEPHLKVVKPVGSFVIPNYPDQTVYVPDVLEIKKIFISGGYDRIICSTELMMGLVALYLKESMAVPVYFFMHTDWLEFFTKTTNLEPQVIDRIRRILRAFYLQFDGIFVMNQDHRNWLTGPAVKFDPDKIFETAHWVDNSFCPLKRERDEFFNGKVHEEDIVFLYAGRLSEEKGVFDLPQLNADLQQKYSRIKFVIAGEGPAEPKLKQQLPEALFLGWVEKEKMPELYAQADLLLLPSRFDTFGNVILEAMSCGTAVAAYAEKGPKSIIKSQKNGILAKDIEDLSAKLSLFVADPAYRQGLKTNSLKRSREYTPERIMESLVRNVGLNDVENRIGANQSSNKINYPSVQTEKRLKKAIGY